MDLILSPRLVRLSHLQPGPSNPQCLAQRGGVGWRARRLIDLPVLLCRQTKAIVWSCDATGSRLSDFSLCSWMHSTGKKTMPWTHKGLNRNLFCHCKYFLSLFFFLSSISIEVQVIVSSKSTYILIVKAMRVHKKLSKSANCLFYFIRLAKSH
jgi:hypothetical protein